MGVHAREMASATSFSRLYICPWPPWRLPERQSGSEPRAPPPPLPPYSHPARSSVTRGRPSPCVQAEGWERQVGLVGLTVARGWAISWQREDWV